MIAYRAMLDVPRELVRYLAGLLAAERRALGTRRRTRSLTCFYQALLILVWFRKSEDKALLGAGFGVCWPSFLSPLIGAVDVSPVAGDGLILCVLSAVVVGFVSVPGWGGSCR